MITNRCKFEKICILYPSKRSEIKLLIFCVINKYRVKQLTIFERTVVETSDLKNCTMVNCVYESELCATL